MTTHADQPVSSAPQQRAALPELYGALIASGAAHGILGRPGPKEANAHRASLGQPAGGAQAPDWTSARLERWRDRALDWLDVHLLGQGNPPATEGEHARAVLAFADVAVRDTWLIRFARASSAEREQAADRLAAIAPSAPTQLRPPIGTILGLAEWTLGRPTAGERLAWATDHGAQDYRLAQLVGFMMDRDIPAATWARDIAGALTERECRHPDLDPSEHPSPEEAGAALAEQGWALRVEAWVELPDGTAWSGTLTHQHHPVATVSQHDPTEPPVLYFPPGSREESAWRDALQGVDVTLGHAISGLDHVGQERAGRAGAQSDPLTQPPEPPEPAAGKPEPIR